MDVDRCLSPGLKKGPRMVESESETDWHRSKVRVLFFVSSPKMKLMPTTSCSGPQTSDIMVLEIATRPFDAPNKNLRRSNRRQRCAKCSR